ncbi:type IV toxin-antitoxin system AbiEi family antitoxin domain-containing protein [Renibacterium salmoninarum]|nr:type IV toxin-antitoxin system AbiEi family antitoxin domain-containing protein [Renibacterium salmoninarum]
MANVTEVLLINGGCARWKRLAQDGVTGRVLRRALDSGEVIRYARGVYGLPTVSPLRIKMHESGGEPACLTAANERGWWVLNPPKTPHISVDHGGQTIDFVKNRSRLPLSALDVMIQVLKCAPELDALVTLTSAVRKKEINLAELLIRIRGSRLARTRAIVARVDLHAESALEVASRYHLENAGFVVTSQVYLPGMGRMDQCINGVLALELMGREFHLSAAAFNEDLRRFNAYTTSGIPVLRVGYAQVVHSPEEFLNLVHRALATIAEAVPH